MSEMLNHISAKKEVPVPTKKSNCFNVLPIYIICNDTKNGKSQLKLAYI